MREYIEVTREDVLKVLRTWETMHQNGDCLTPEEVEKLSTQERAEASCAWFWKELCNNVGSATL